MLLFNNKNLNMKYKNLLLLLLACLITATIVAQKVVQIKNFGNDGTFQQVAPQTEDIVRNELIQPDGKILISITSNDDFGYTTEELLYRLNTDGTLDKSFANAGIL